MSHGDGAATERSIEQQIATLRPAQRDLLNEALGTFGINPAGQPRELLAFRVAGDPDAFEPLVVSLVTAGGRKLTWPLDERTERELRYNVFHAYKADRRTGDVTELPLPDDLRLPDHAKTGIPPAPHGGALWRR